MIIDYCNHGSKEWDMARCGLPTASNFGKIMTPTGKKSSQSDAYMNLLVAEWLLGVPVENQTYGLMDHGTETEAQARDMYEFMTGNEVVEVGVVYKDEDKLIGCSPDAMLCNVPRGTEIKCPAPHTHISYLLAKGLPLAYVPQVQGSMYVTGYKEWDFMSFHTDFPELIITVKRDEFYIQAFDKLVKKFIQTMIEKRNKLREYRR